MPSLTIVTIGHAGSGIVNDGTINANLSGGTFIITDGSFTNASTGTINVANGDLVNIELEQFYE